MEKTIEQVIYETEQSLIDIIENSGLSPAILELIVRSIYRQLDEMAHAAPQNTPITVDKTQKEE